MLSLIPRIAVTPGEPAGIGPDLAVSLGQGMPEAELVIIADSKLLAARAKQLGLSWAPLPFPPPDGKSPQANCVRVLHISGAESACSQQLDPIHAAYVLHTLESACTGCMQNTFAALVTGPVHKWAINQAGYAFSGHTEWLAQYCGGDPVMMLVTQGLRVALVTTHLPLAQVSCTLTAQRLEQVLRIVHKDLIQRFGLVKPRILVCGLNPHAGEHGYLGHEEQDIIIPVLDRLRKDGLTLVGPVPADSAFLPQRLKQIDVVLSMYHDQGLPVLKHRGFGRAANITLGLPIIRVSVDHGTALELAGTGQVDTGSFRYALQTAIWLWKQSIKQNISASLLSGQKE